MINYMDLFGIKISVVDLEGAVEQVINCIPNKNGDFFCFSTIHNIMESLKDAKLKKAMSQAQGIFPDGMGIALSLRILGKKFKGRVRGIEFMLKLCSYAAKNNLAIALYGSTQGNLLELNEKLSNLFPCIRIPAVISPPFRNLSQEEDSKIIEQINKSGADILFVALGAPKQEKWMAEHKGEIKPVQLGVGVTFDFITGRIREAPVWMQRTALEWLFRLLQQPKKVIYRMSLVPEFIFRLLVKIIKENILGLKRLFDICISFLGLLISLPLWIAISLAILLEDGWPIFYSQERIGKDGKIFKAVKFRSMVKDAEKITGPIQAGENDARVTKIGMLLRHSAMDELPQLINILKGDMSFVGPRALRPKEREIQDESVRSMSSYPEFKERSKVRPGLTGIAQVFAPRNIDRKHKFKYDLWYIRNQSFLLDIYIIILSFLITFAGRWEIGTDKLKFLAKGIRQRLDEYLTNREEPRK